MIDYDTMVDTICPRGHDTVCFEIPHGCDRTLPVISFNLSQSPQMPIKPIEFGETCPSSFIHSISSCFVRLFRLMFHRKYTVFQWFASET